MGEGVWGDVLEKKNFCLGIHEKRSRTGEGKSALSASDPSRKQGRLGGGGGNSKKKGLTCRERREDEFRTGEKPIRRLLFSGRLDSGEKNCKGGTIEIKAVTGRKLYRGLREEGNEIKGMVDTTWGSFKTTAHHHTEEQRLGVKEKKSQTKDKRGGVVFASTRGSEQLYHGVADRYRTRGG